MCIRTVLLTIVILQGSLASAQPTGARQIPDFSAPSADAGAASEDTVTLEQAVAIGVQNNLPLLAERFNVTITEVNEITARLRPNPVFSFEGTHLDMLGTGYDLINNAGPAEFAFRTEFVFERGNKRQNRIDVAFQSRETARLRVLDVLRSVVLDIQIAFVDTLLAKANLGLAEEILRGFSDLVTVNEARVPETWPKWSFSGHASRLFNFKMRFARRPCAFGRPAIGCNCCLALAARFWRLT